MRRLTAFLSLTLLCACASAGTASGEPSPPPLYLDAEAMVRDARAVTEDFHARLRALGNPLSVVPSVTIESESGLLYYDDSTKRIILPIWPELSAPARELYGMIAGPEDGAEHAFRWISWFYLPHELAHQALDESPGVGMGHYQLERAASTWALAYWNARGERARLAYMRSFVAAATARLAAFDPAPVGGDRAAHFHANYDALLGDPPAYAYSQLRMLDEIFSFTPDVSLDEMARRLPRE